MMPASLKSINTKYFHLFNQNVACMKVLIEESKTVLIMPLTRASNAAKKALLNKKATPITLKHCFAIHLKSEYIIIESITVAEHVRIVQNRLEQSSKYGISELIYIIIISFA